jgi:hypothetical protein
MPEYLKYFPTPFLEDLVGDLCLPFIGAGFSLNARLPVGKKMLDWDALGKEVAATFPDYQYTTPLEALSSYAHEYSKAKLVELLSKTLLTGAAQPGAAHDAFCRLPFERVVTTNFDFLLEQSYATLGRYCLPLISEDQLAVGSGQVGVKLLKLHGDLHHPARLVVTEEDYDAFLSTYPLFATHLSSLLIGQTAFFIGYSLDDPDFRQIWHVVKERLGQLRRPAYVLQVGAHAYVAARYERRGVKVIDLPRSSTRSYGETLEIAFKELFDYWTSQTLAQSTTTETEPQAELALPLAATSRLAFFSVPTKLAGFYKMFAYPLAERHDFIPIMAADVIAPGDSITAKVSALLEKAAVVIADLDSPNTLVEVGMLLSRESGQGKLISIVEEGLQVPIDVTRAPVISRPRDLSNENHEFLQSLDQRLEALSQALAPARENEAVRLMQKKEYRAAVVAAFTQLEHDLRTALSKPEPGAFGPRVSMLQLVDRGVERGFFRTDERGKLREFVAVRNQLVHTKEGITSARAKHIVKDLTAYSTRLRQQGGGQN